MLSRLTTLATLFILLYTYPPTTPARASDNQEPAVVEAVVNKVLDRRGELQASEPSIPSTKTSLHDASIDGRIPIKIHTHHPASAHRGDLDIVCFRCYVASGAAQWALDNGRCLAITLPHGGGIPIPWLERC